MARLFLHIGAHKTATSYLQALFHHNRRTLAQAGLYYPDIGPNKAHHALAAPWIDLPDLPPHFFKSEGPDALWDRAILRPFAKVQGTVFLSAENFSRTTPQSVDIADLAKKLAVFEDVKIVFTLRAQTEMVSSMWMQAARFRKPPVLRAYIKRVFESGQVGGVSVDYNAFYHRLLAGFQPDQIVFLDYDTIRARNGGVAQSFLDLMGCPLRTEDLRPPPVETHNISPDPLSLYLASQITREAGPPPQTLVDVAARALHRDGQVPTTLLSQREYQRVVRKFAAGNARVVDMVSRYQPDFRFDPKPAPENMLYRDQIAQHVWPDIAAALWNCAPPNSRYAFLKRAGTVFSDRLKGSR